MTPPSNKEPLVSVVIPTYNRGATVKAAIESALNQTYINLEVIVVDDGSTDDTGAIVKSIADPRLKYFFRENSGNASYPRNEAIARSSGALIAFLDSDDLWLTDKVKLQVEYLINDPAAAMVFSDIYLISEKGEDIGLFSDTSHPSTKQVFSQLLRQNFIANSTGMVRREILERLGPLSTNYKICHDLDFYLKVAKEYPVGYIDLPLAKVRTQSVSLTGNRALMFAEIATIVAGWEKEGKAELGARRFNGVVARYAFRAGLYDTAAGNREEALRWLKVAAGKNPLNPGYLLVLIFTYVTGPLAEKLLTAFFSNRSGKE